MAVLLKAGFGNCLVLKKSGLLRCSSRFGLLVSTLSGLMSSVNEVLAGSEVLTVNAPESSSNRPWIQDRPRCEALKLALEWAGSTEYSWALTGEETAETA